MVIRHSDLHPFPTMMRNVIPVTVLIILLITLLSAPVCDAVVIQPPPAGMLYHGAYTPPRSAMGAEHTVTAYSIRSYEQNAKKKAAWIYFSHEWGRNRAFPSRIASIIRNSGAVPYIRLMLRSTPDQNRPESVFTLDRIIAGSFDQELKRWAYGAKRFRTPVLIEYGTEMNGEWFPWNARWNGKEEGAEKFRRAYRHIISIMDSAGASNLIWVFHINGGDYPAHAWNRFERYYPGDGYIDWIGISAYGPQTPLDASGEQFSTIINRIYPRVIRLAPDKPIIISEFGACSRHPRVSQAGWAGSALKNLTSHRWPQVIGFSWWNEGWENDNNPAHDTNMRIQDNPRLSKVFRNYIGKNPRILGRPIVRMDGMESERMQRPQGLKRDIQAEFPAGKEVGIRITGEQGMTPVPALRRSGTARTDPGTGEKPSIISDRGVVN